MATLIDFHKAIAPIIPEGWTYEIDDETSLARLVVYVTPLPDAAWDDWLLVRTALEHELGQVRPAGLAVQIERVAPATAPLAPPEVDEDFVRTMRALRGDYGACEQCGEAFGEHEKTETDNDKRVHPGCVVRGHCAGCLRPVVVKERWALHNGSLVHADCVEDAQNREERERERRAAQARKEARAATRGGLITEAINASRKPGAVVALVLPASQVEEEARRIVGRPSPPAWFASSKPAQKAIAWRDTTGMLIIEAASANNLTPAKNGYTEAYVSLDAQLQLAGLPEIVSRCFGLEHRKITLEQ